MNDLQKRFLVLIRAVMEEGMRRESFLSGCRGGPALSTGSLTGSKTVAQRACKAFRDRVLIHVVSRRLVPSSDFQQVTSLSPVAVIIHEVVHKLNVSKPFGWIGS